MTDQITILPPERERTAYALLFAVENYISSGIGRVNYAERDATAIREALLDLGYEEANIQLTISEAATAASIRYEAKQLAGTAHDDDSVFFFFAGHGYTWQGRNYLMCRDTRLDDIEDTAISLQSLFDLFAQAVCKQVMFFLDCCHSGLHLGDDSRGVLEDFSAEEIKEYFRDADFCVVFSACNKGEKSYPSRQFQHGYWTYHLLRALKGEEPGILDAEGFLRSTKLQDYLRVEVPKQLALQSTARRRQNPKMVGDVSGTFVGADVGPLLQRRIAERQAEAVSLREASLRRIQSGQVRDLSGFNKARGHRPPTLVNSTSRSWVAGLAEGDIEAEMNEIFEKIRKAAGYKRKELIYDSPADGSASIRTPDFAFTINYSQCENDPSEYEVVQELTRLSNPETLESDWFNDVFKRVFNEAVVEFSGPLDVTEFIDLAEECRGLVVHYDKDATYCEITLKGFEGTITVTADSMTYRFRNAETPKEMAVQLESANTLLLGMSGMQKTLPL